jgi:hypothetical protein
MKSMPNIKLLQKNWVDAAAECCKMNMSLLSAETIEEQACIAKMVAGSMITIILPLSHIEIFQ